MSTLSVENVLSGDHQKLNSLKNQFNSIGVKWKQLIKETGKFLLQAKDSLSDGSFAILINWIGETYAIKPAQQTLCMEVAKGTIPEELVGRIPASTLIKIDPKNMPELNTKYSIWSPTDGGVVLKTPLEMNKQELKFNIGSHGVKSIDEVVKKDDKPLSTSRADMHRVDGKNLVLFVKSLNKEITYKITQQLINDLNAAM